MREIPQHQPSKNVPFLRMISDGSKKAIHGTVSHKEDIVFSIIIGSAIIGGNVTAVIVRGIMGAVLGCAIGTSIGIAFIIFVLATAFVTDTGVVGADMDIITVAFGAIIFVVLGVIVSDLVSAFGAPGDIIGAVAGTVIGLSGLVIGEDTVDATSVIAPGIVRIITRFPRKLVRPTERPVALSLRSSISPTSRDRRWLGADALRAAGMTEPVISNFESALRALDIRVADVELNWSESVWLAFTYQRGRASGEVRILIPHPSWHAGRDLSVLPGAIRKHLNPPGRVMRKANVEPASRDSRLLYGADALRAAGMTEPVISNFESALRALDIRVADVELNSSTTVSLKFKYQVGGTSGTAWIDMPSPSPSAHQALTSLPGAIRKHDWRVGPARWPKRARWARWEHFFSWSDRRHSWSGKARRVTDWPRGKIGGWWTPEMTRFAEGAAALWFIGKLADAYVSRLADSLAESTFKAARRIRYMKRRRQRCVKITVPEGSTTIVLPEGDLSDDAKEAFIDLDPTADGICGKTLHWDPERRAWVARD